jgi:putative DNA methylase
VDVVSPKKLIEVALPLDAINAAAAREKSIRHGHPSTLHLWWARRPLAAARAVIFSQLVHDPEDLWRYQNPGETPNRQHKGHWTKRRTQLFDIIKELVLWENTTNERVLNKAREEIQRAWQESCELNKNHPDAEELFNPEKMPGLHDPFAGGGAIPLEAQRLGLEAYASDLNPVAVLINKAMIEIPPKFAGKPPVHPDGNNPLLLWKGAAGLAADVRYYGKWMREEAFKRIGHLYPQVEVTSHMVEERPDLKEYEGKKLTVIAWLWARTVKSPNPAFSHVEVPLASTFVLSSKEKREAYIDPIIEEGGYRFTVKVGKPPEGAKMGTTAGKRAAFVCLMSKSPMSYEFIRREGQARRLGKKLMAIVAEGERGRLYISPTSDQQMIAEEANPEWQPELKLNGKCRVNVSNYGLDVYGDLFTPRQLVALTTFSDLVSEARGKVVRDALAAGMPDDEIGLDADGTGARAYAEAVSVYLAFGVDRLADRCSALCGWDCGYTKIRNTFGRQALPMVWDFTEGNVFSESTGNFEDALMWIVKVTENAPAVGAGCVSQSDAQNQGISNKKFISSDPPYYDNIGYADLSDFFYVWLRRSLRSVFPNLLATISVPKVEELVAAPYRHGNKENAEKFFLEGMTQAMKRLAMQSHQSAPVTIYYAFKQSETNETNATSSSGWVTFLEAVLESGFSLTGTWPMRTELGNRMIGTGTNALASSIVLVCRRRAKNAGTIDRRRFQRLLNETLPLALDAMTRESEGEHSPVAPVDLSQAIIGPGMALFSRYDAVLEADGTKMSVKTALQLINRFLAEDDFDADTQFCLHWFEQHEWNGGKFGDADTLARAKGTSVDGVKQAGVIESGAGNVRLFRWREYPGEEIGSSGRRFSVWEALHQIIFAFNKEGDSGAAEVLASVASKTEAIRQLAYRLYTLCERRGLTEDARAYNEIITGWSGIESAALRISRPEQRSLFEDGETQ